LPIFRKIGKNSACEGDIAGFNRNACGIRKCLHDWQKRIGGEGWGLIRLGVNDLRSAHLIPFFPPTDIGGAPL
jgi:hypothetical protein